MADPVKPLPTHISQTRPPHNEKKLDGSMAALGGEGANSDVAYDVTKSKAAGITPEKAKQMAAEAAKPQERIQEGVTESEHSAEDVSQTTKENVSADGAAAVRIAQLEATVASQASTITSMSSNERKLQAEITALGQELEISKSLQMTDADRTLLKEALRSEANQASSDGTRLVVPKESATKTFGHEYVSEGPQGPITRLRRIKFEKNKPIRVAQDIYENLRDSKFIHGFD